MWVAHWSIEDWSLKNTFKSQTLNEVLAPGSWEVSCLFDEAIEVLLPRISAVAKQPIGVSQFLKLMLDGTQSSKVWEPLVYVVTLFYV